MTGPYCDMHSQNPFSYYEDSTRVLPQLKKLECASASIGPQVAALTRTHSTYPLKAIAKQIDAKTLVFSVPEEAEKSWMSATKEPYEIPLVTRPDDSVLLTCPSCDFLDPTGWPWVNDAGTGWSQRGFSAQCSKCAELLSHEVRNHCVRG